MSCLLPYESWKHNFTLIEVLKETIVCMLMWGLVIFFVWITKYVSQSRSTLSPPKKFHKILTYDSFLSGKGSKMEKAQTNFATGPRGSQKMMCAYHTKIKYLCVWENQTAVYKLTNKIYLQLYCNSLFIQGTPAVTF